MREMVKYTLPLCLFVTALLTNVQAQRIGEWTSYLSFSSIHHLADAEDRVYGASAMALFHYDKEDYTLQTYSKGDGLSDVGIRTIAYDGSSKSLFVAYNNGNLDIIQNDRTHNVSGIKQWDYIGDKSINSISFNNNRAYLGCGFGLVVVNIPRKEIEETYYFTASGGYNCSVSDVAFTDTSIVAATSKGLLSAKRGDYLNIEENWTLDTSQLWTTHTPERIAIIGNRMTVTATGHDPSTKTLYYKSPNGYISIADGNIQSIHSHNNHLIVSYWDSIAIYDTNLTPVRMVNEYIYGDMLAYDAIESADGRLWIGHDWAGLIVVNEDETMFSTHPESPVSDNVYHIRPINNGIAICPGGKTSTNANLYLSGNIYTYTNQGWSQLDRTSGLQFFDVLDVAVDPNDNSHLSAAAWGCGIVDIRKNTPQTVYADSNSDGTLIPYSSGTFTTMRTGSLAYDAQGNLWILNSLSNNGLVAHYADGSWKSFNTQSLVQGAETDKILWDSVTGYLWFAGNSNRIFVHNGFEKQAWVDPNHGSKLQTTSVTCMVQDQNGHIWIGTNKGIKVIYDGYKAFNNGGNGEQSPVSCSNILFSEDDKVEYLLAYEAITSITVDGANRKWVGTAAGGLYLLSATGLEQIENFTTANSPLFSNKIIDVGIHPVTGEVFIGTDVGIQSYRSTATYANIEPEKKIHVFPNPVRPEYDGPVAIRGFSRNAIVHITDEAGHVVYSTRADGGQAIWYIRNNSGVRVSSGVYFVFASDEEGHNKSVGKVLVIK